MDFIFEILLDLIIEGCFEASINKKVPKIRSPINSFNCFIFYICTIRNIYSRNIFMEKEHIWWYVYNFNKYNFTNCNDLQVKKNVYKKREYKYKVKTQ